MKEKELLEMKGKELLHTKNESLKQCECVFIQEYFIHKISPRINITQ